MPHVMPIGRLLRTLDACFASRQQRNSQGSAFPRLQQAIHDHHHESRHSPLGLEGNAYHYIPQHISSILSSFPFPQSAAAAPSGASRWNGEHQRRGLSSLEEGQRKHITPAWRQTWDEERCAVRQVPPASSHQQEGVSFRPDHVVLFPLFPLSMGAPLAHEIERRCAEADGRRLSGSLGPRSFGGQLLLS